jgi:hypothetical protein
MCHHINFEYAGQDVHAQKISKETVDHIKGCVICLDAIQLLAQSLGIPSATLTPACTCSACQSSLATYIEIEERDPASAARDLPSIWWHLWSCSVCAEVYRLTHILFDSARRGDIPPLPGSS